MKVAFDQFYTNPKVSNKLVKHTLKYVNKLGYKKITWLEPSAGSGNFLDSLLFYGEKKIKAYDIDPKRNEILKKDFLEIKKIQPLRGTELVVIGNPPFGKRASLAIDFFNKSSEFADTIAMIFPKQFRKWSVHSKLNKEFKLISDIDIEDDAFLVNNSKYHVGTCYQIWTRKATKMKDLRIKESPALTHKDFEIFQHNNTKQTQKYFDKKQYGWSFAVHRQGFYDYKKIITNEKYIRNNPNKQWMFFKAKPEIIKKLKSIDFEKLSKQNTTIPGFGKADVIKEYKRLWN